MMDLPVDDWELMEGEIEEYARVTCGKQVIPNLCNMCKSVADNGF